MRCLTSCLISINNLTGIHLGLLLSQIKSIRNVFLHDPSPDGLPFLESLAFVKLFLTSGKGDIHLGSTVLVDENQNRDDGKTHILGSGLEMTYLSLLEQKFAVTLSLVIGKEP